MTDQKKEKCREDVQQIVAEIITANFISSDAQIQREMLRDAFIDELLKREQREEKLVECLKDCLPHVHHSIAIAINGSMIIAAEDALTKTTNLLKELGYE